MLFTDLPLDHRLQKSLALHQFEQATDIQEKAIPQALLGKDVLASSKTGSGKTLAFLVPAINRIFKEKALSKKDPRILIVTPTRELAKQVFVELKKLIPTTSGKPALLIGGENFNDQVKLLKRYPHFVVGTPGRVADHIEDKSLFLEGLELLIMDEADRILDLGFSTQLKIINDAANHRKRQTMMFSATFDHADLAQIAEMLLVAPHRITVDDQHLGHIDIAQRFYYADHIQHKEKLTQHFLSQIPANEQAIVFCATREDTDRLALLLSQENINSKGLHGDLLQSQRNAIMSEFDSRQFQCLVTTDLASRGLDIPNVRLVINLDLPVKAAEYVHRIGRTGRAGAKGNAISLVSKKDWKSFLLLKQFLSEAPLFDSVEHLPAKFSGLKTSNSRAAQQGVRQNSQKAQSKKSEVKKKNKFNALAGTDVGHMTIKKKPRPPTE